MKFWLKIYRFSRGDRLLIIKVYLLISAIILGLKIFKYQTVQNFLDRLAKTKAQKNFSLYKIVWAVTQISPYFPNVKCLVRAMTTKFLLQREGYHPNLCIGVTKDRQGQFLAHAWVENQGKIVMGGIGNSIGNYQIMPMENIDLSFKKFSSI